jgi:hypothetical protein
MYVILNGQLVDEKSECFAFATGEALFEVNVLHIYTIKKKSRRFLEK